MKPLVIACLLLGGLARADEVAQSLDAPKTQCRAAAALAKQPSRHDLVPLVRAYRHRGEGQGRCLLDALVTIARAVDLAAGLDAAPAEEREAVYETMAHAPSRGWQATLESAALTEASGKLRGAAYRALRSQGSPEAWSVAMQRLLARASLAVRAELVQRLFDDLDDPACRAVLVWQAGREPDPGLRGKIKARLR